MAAHQSGSTHPLVADFIAHRPLLQRVACRWMGDRDLAEDGKTACATSTSGTGWPWADEGMCNRRPV